MELAHHGDLFDVLMTRQIVFDDKLARTYFHQLVNGLQYLHSNRIGHMDIKPDNLLLSHSFQLKIADFDSSVMMDQTDISRGTLYYRAPEVIEAVCSDAKAADVYSAGVVLFLLKCGGTLPHLEHEEFEGCDLLDLLHNNNKGFWQKHCEIQKKTEGFFDEEFRSLFGRMTKMHATERLTLEEVKESAWYQGPTYSEEELRKVMAKKFEI